MGEAREGEMGREGREVSEGMNDWRGERERWVGKGREGREGREVSEGVSDGRGKRGRDG